MRCRTGIRPAAEKFDRTVVSRTWRLPLTAPGSRVAGVIEQLVSRQRPAMNLLARFAQDVLHLLLRDPQQSGRLAQPDVAGGIGADHHLDASLRVELKQSAKGATDRRLLIGEQAAF